MNFQQPQWVQGNINATSNFQNQSLFNNNPQQQPSSIFSNSNSSSSSIFKSNQNINISTVPPNNPINFNKPAGNSLFSPNNTIQINSQPQFPLQNNVEISNNNTNQNIGISGNSTFENEVNEMFGLKPIIE